MGSCKSPENIHLSLVLDDETTISFEMSYKDNLSELCRNICIQYNLSERIGDKLKSKIASQINSLKKEEKLTNCKLEKDVIHRLHYKSKDERINKEKSLEKIRKDKASQEVKYLTFTPKVSHIKDYKKPFKCIEDKLYYEEMVARNNKGLQRIINGVVNSEGNVQFKKKVDRTRKGSSIGSMISANDYNLSCIKKVNEKVKEQVENNAANEKNMINNTSNPKKSNCKSDINAKISIFENKGKSEKNDTNILPKNKDGKIPFSNCKYNNMAFGMFPIVEKQNSFGSYVNTSPENKENKENKENFKGLNPANNPATNPKDFDAENNKTKNSSSNLGNIVNSLNSGNNPQNTLNHPINSNMFINKEIKRPTEDSISQINTNNNTTNFLIDPARKFSFATKEHPDRGPIGTYAEKYKLQQLQQQSHNVTNCSFVSSQSKAHYKKSLPRPTVQSSELKKRLGSEQTANQFLLRDLSEGIGDKILNSLRMSDSKPKEVVNIPNFLNDDSFAIYSEPGAKISGRKMTNNEFILANISPPISPRSIIDEKDSSMDLNSERGRRISKTHKFNNLSPDKKGTNVERKRSPSTTNKIKTANTTRSNSECIFSYRKIKQEEEKKKSVLDRLYTDHNTTKRKKEECLQLINKKDCPFQPSISERTRQIAKNLPEHRRNISVFNRLHSNKRIKLESIISPVLSSLRSVSAKSDSRFTSGLMSCTSLSKLAKSSNINYMSSKSHSNNSKSITKIKSRHPSDALSTTSTKRTRFKIREIKQENKIYEEIAKISSSSNNLSSKVRNKFYENINKFKKENLKEIFDLICSNCKKVNDFLQMEKFGIPKTLKDKLVLPSLYIIKERKLEFNFENFFSIAREIINFII